MSAIELSIDTCPPALLFNPALAHPMVFHLTRREVRRKATTDTGRHSLLAQKGRQQQGKVTARANLTVVNVAGL